ncbi:MAG: hypothetical protein NT055_03105 [Nitrospirae bacterium]|nr:hypothetical protein [Nitrospirota bacterium]
MEHEFGLKIRMYLCDIVKALLNSKEITQLRRDYLNAMLRDGELLEALGAKPDRQDEERSSLDELFQRSICLNSSKKYAEAITFISLQKV